MSEVAPGLVSTVIPVHNRALLLREAVASVLAQTYRPIEVLVVDDGSTDDTSEACAALAAAHPEMRVLRIANGGPGLAREAGRALVRGEFVQYLDSDDLLAARKFEVQVAALRAHPECGAAYCATYEHELGMPPAPRASAQTGSALETLFPQLLAGRIWQTVSPLLRRSVVEAVGPWSDLRQEEDWEYDARVAALGTRLAWNAEFLAHFRHHAGARAGGDSLRDARKMRWRQRAHTLIYSHARRAGLGSDNPFMQRYARELFLLARQCGAAGLGSESRTLFEQAREASGAVRGRGWDFRAYSLAARIVGWPAVGRFACWTDRLRPATSAA